MVTFPPLKSVFTHVIARGDKVELQLPSMSHKKQFMDFVNRNRDFHEPWVFVSGDPAYYDQYIRRMKMGKMIGFFVFTRDDNQFAGVVNLNSIRLDPFSSASLGYYAEESLCGNGYMKEAIRLVLAHAFQKIGLNRVEVNIQPGNTASIRLVKAVGFEKEGFSRKYLQIGNDYRDHERWAYLAEDFSE
ncbi:MAG: GNAT family protein [Emcibacteraceae bacterium]